MAAKSLRKLLEGKDAFHQAHGIAKFASRLTLPLTPCQIRKNRPGIPKNLVRVAHGIECARDLYLQLIDLIKKAWRELLDLIKKHSGNH